MTASPIPDEQPVVYVVDDDASVRTALEDLLASVGLAVRTFGSTAEFLAHTMERAPGCLVLDVRMPGQSGLDFHRQMRNMGIGLPVIFITGHGDIAMSVEAMKNGAIEFLTKPFPGSEPAGRDTRGHREGSRAPQERSPCARFAGELGFAYAGRAGRGASGGAGSAEQTDRR